MNSLAVADVPRPGSQGFRSDKFLVTGLCQLHSRKALALKPAQPSGATTHGFRTNRSRPAAAECPCRQDWRARPKA